MGVGYERDIVAAVLAGIDMFDCVLPTRNGRNANAFTPNGQLRLRNASNAEDPGPIDPECDCPACDPKGCGAGVSDRPVFSRGYIRHLFMADEMLGPILVYSTLTVPAVMLEEAFLSFLGLGVQPPMASWGSLANEGATALNALSTRWWLIAFPGAFLGVTLLALNFLGDGLRDVFDPRSERRDAAD